MDGAIAQFVRDGAAAQPQSTLWQALEKDAPLLTRAQALLDQLMLRPHAPLGQTDHAHASHLPPPVPGAISMNSDRLWCLVTVVAASISQQLECNATGRPPPLHVPRTKDRATSKVPWHLIELLLATRVPLAQFLQCFSTLMERLALDGQLVDVATHLKEDLTVSTVLYEKYRAFWFDLALQPSNGHDSKQNGAKDRRSESDRENRRLFEAGWLLFLIARRRLTEHFQGLGQHYFLLLGSLHMVLLAQKHEHCDGHSVEVEVATALSTLGATTTATSTSTTTPTTSGVIPTTSTSTSSTAAGSTGSGADITEEMFGEAEAKTLRKLCSQPKVDEKEVKRAIGHIRGLVRDLLTERVLIVGDKATNSPWIDIWSTPNAKDNVERLAEYYRAEEIVMSASLDERFHLDPEKRQVIVPRPANTTATAAGNSNGMHSTSQHGSHHFSSQAGVAPPNTAASRGSIGSPPLTPQRREARLISRMVGSASSPMTSWQWNGTGTPPVNLTRMAGTPRALLSTAAAQRSPLVMQTPVTAALETSNWVRDVLGESAAVISPQLTAFFQECTQDPTEFICQTIQTLAQKLVDSKSRGSGITQPLDDLGGVSVDGSENALPLSSREPTSSEERLVRMKDLGIALFYRVLEVLLVSERDRLQSSNFSSLLHNESFIKSLFACCLESVLKAHSMVTFAFPKLLLTLGVNAFDFGKIIESFVKHVPHLPTALKRHMRDLEQVILESLAWRSDSALYSLLPPPSGSSAPGPDGASPVPASRVSILQLFFRKVLALAASRIYRLGTALELDAKYLNQIWTAVKECVSSQHQLLRDRHLDHAILCSIYGVSKVNHLKPEVTFKRIIDCYKKLHSSHWGSSSFSNHGFAVGSGISAPHEVIRSIRLNTNDSYGDIIKFYNKCYIPMMKLSLLQFQHQDKQQAAADAAAQSATKGIPGADGRKETGTTHMSTSDAEIVAEAAAAAVDRFLSAQSTSNVPTRRAQPRAASFSGSTSSSLPLFSSTEVETLPVSVQHTSPKRVLASNVYMSPLQQARLQHQRTQLTPRSHALYAFGESPSRDLALINRAVNADRLPLPPFPASLTSTSDPSNDTVPAAKRQKL